VVEVFINVNGSVDEVKLVKSGGAAFDDAVIKSVNASFFEPGYMDGKQVAVRMQIPYVFKLR
jgi:TonB family protein